MGRGPTTGGMLASPPPFGEPVRTLLTSAVLLVAPAAHAQVVATPAFAPEFTEDWENAQGGFPLCQDFAGVGEACSGALSGTSGWSFHCNLGPFSGSKFIGSASGATTLTFGGGVNEVQRDIIAMAGLGLPRARR